MSELYKAGFIGCGNMGGTLAAVCCESVGGKNVAVCDLDAAKTGALADKYGAAVTDARTLCASCEFVFLGLKPQYMASALEAFRDVLLGRTDCTVVTMAAGLEIGTVRAMLGGYSGKLIRIMPNLCAAVGEGMILVSPGEGVESADTARLQTLLAKAGQFRCLPEKLIDAGCSVSGCGPAYVYMFIEALADGGVACGLSRADAQLLAAQTVLGAAKIVLQNGNPGAQKDAVCSPAGSTIAGVRALEEAGFRAAAMDAVIAAYERNVALKKA